MIPSELWAERESCVGVKDDLIALIHKETFAYARAGCRRK